MKREFAENFSHFIQQYQRLCKSQGFFLEIERSIKHFENMEMKENVDPLQSSLNPVQE